MTKPSDQVPAQHQEKTTRRITERTENIIGAAVIIIGIVAILAIAGYAVPNYYVYFKNTLAKVGQCNTEN